MPITLTCPHCQRALSVGPEHAGQVLACPLCANHFQVPAAPVAATAATHPLDFDGGKSCPYCGESIQRGAKKCRHCGEYLDRNLRRDNAPAKWSPGVAAVLSFFWPGLGQMYKGSVIGGFLWMIVVITGYFMMVVPGLILHLICILAAASGNPRA